MKKSNVVFSALVCALSLVAASGCGMLKMPETTEEMNKTTKEMNRTTKDGMDKTYDKMTAMKDGMDETIRQLAKMLGVTEQGMRDTLAAMCNMYQDMRQGTAIDIRTNRLKTLAEANNQAKKISEAGKYMMAFEFQLLKTTGCSNQDSLESYKHQAAEELFRDLTDFGVAFENINIKSKNSNDMALNALAVALHRVNPNAEALAEMNHTPKTSMLSIIEETLKRKAMLDEYPEQKLPFEREILNNEEAAVYMLQLRSVFLGAMALEQLTHISEMGVRAKLRARYFSGATVDFGDLNISKIETYTTWLKEAARVRGFLKSLGYATPMDNNLAAIYNRMDLYKSDLRTAPSKKAAQVRAKLEAELEAAINKYRSWK